MKKFFGFIFTLALALVLASCGKHTHTFSEEWTNDATSHWHAATCEHAEEVNEKADHTWDGGKVTVEPTEQAEGKKVFTCTVCQYKKEEKINKLTHEHSWVDANCTTPKTCSKCNATEGEALGHTPAEAVKENEVAATCKAAGSYDLVVYCSVCEAEISREAKTVDKLAHTPAEAVKENEVAATCSKAGSYDLVVYCSVCEVEISREAKTVDKLAHTPAEAVKENEVTATCTAEGSYDLVVYCSETGCGAEISREAQTVEMLEHDYDTTGWGYKSADGHAHGCKHCEAHDTLVPHIPNMEEPTEDDPVVCTACGYVITPATGHIKHTAKEEWVNDETHHWHECIGCLTEKLNYAEHNWGDGVVTTNPTCTDKGVKTYTCECGKTKTEEVDSLGHTPSEAVEENKVESTCIEAGKYDLVVYCSVCNSELNRETKTLELAVHTLETVEAKAPTCTEDGIIVHKHCSVCEKNFDDEENELSSIVDPAKHTPAEAVEENRIPATCTANGSYDLVVYCNVCENELSRKTETITSEGHTPAEAVEENRIPATCTANGSYDLVVYCSVCENELSRKTETIISEGHKVETYESNGDATCTEDGTKTGECSVCHEMITITDEESALDHDWSEEKTLDATYELEGKVYKECNREGCDEEDIIEVLPQLVSVTEVKLSGEYYMDLGATQTIAATVSPEDAHDKTLTWESSDPTIATVDENGLVTAVKPGNVTITAVSQNDPENEHDNVDKTFEVLVLEALIDSEKDEFYDLARMFSGQRTNPTVTHNTSIVLGENGIYVYQIIEDGKGITDTSHVELYFTLGDTEVSDNSLGIHIHPNNYAKNKAYSISSTVNNQNDTLLDLYCQYSSKIISNESTLGKYSVELFIDYSYFGITEAPETIKVQISAVSGGGNPLTNSAAGASARQDINKYIKCYMMETLIDGEKDEFYNQAVTFSGQRTNPTVTHNTSIVLGENGIYVYQIIEDGKGITDTSHVELYFTLGDTQVSDNSLGIHIHPNNNAKNKAYSISSTVNKQNDTLLVQYCQYSSKIISNESTLGKYSVELFIDYSYFGITEAPETIKVQISAVSGGGNPLTNSAAGASARQDITKYLLVNSNSID